MKFMLIAIGTRGDVEPFLAVGELLQNHGHEVIGLFPEQYGSLAKESDIAFLPFDAGFIEMIEGEVGKQALGGATNFFQRIQAYYQLYKVSKKVNNKIFKEQIDFISKVNPDRIIHSIKATVPIHWGYITGKPSINLSPIPCVTHSVKDRSSMAFRGKNFGKIVNEWTYQFTRWASIKNLRVFLKKLGEEDPGQRSLTKAMLNEIAVFTVSPNFFRLENQPSHVHFLGYQERNKEKHWQPSDSLNQFLERHKRFLFITFGSMSNPDPEKKTQIIISTLAKLGIPAIINTAGGGLSEPQSYDEKMVHFVKSIPYDWILPKAYACIHHGGSGTTHLALKYACPTTIIPHIVDQYFWNNVLSDLQLGPKGIAVAKLKESNFEGIVTDLWYNPKYKEAAESFSLMLKKENFEEQILSVLTN